MNRRHTILLMRYFMAFVWLANGLLCKVLNLVPRHEQIVREVLNTEWSREIIILIGLGEVCIAFWILLNVKVKLHTILQVFLVAIMNILEFIITPELLMWGKVNSVFALVFIAVVIYHFYLFSHE